jgi:hypothetical protein
VNGISPAGVAIAFWRWAWICAGVLALAGGFILIGWRVGWWFTAQDVTRQARVVQNNYATQEGYISAITDDVAQLDGVIASEPGAADASALRAQAIGIGNQACLEASYLTGSVPVTPTMKSWISGNCYAGAVSLTSPLRNGTGN